MILVGGVESATKMLKFLKYHTSFDKFTIYLLRHKKYRFFYRSTLYRQLNKRIRPIHRQLSWQSYMSNGQFNWLCSNLYLIHSVVTNPIFPATKVVKQIFQKREHKADHLPDSRGSNPSLATTRRISKDSPPLTGHADLFPLFTCPVSHNRQWWLKSK